MNIFNTHIYAPMDNRNNTLSASKELRTAMEAVNNIIHSRISTMQVYINLYKDIVVLWWCFVTHDLSIILSD